MDSTEKLISAIPAKVGRKKRWAEDMQARFPEGTFARIEAVMEEGEDRTDFVRAAVEAELRRRKAPPAKAEPKAGREQSTTAILSRKHR